MIARSTAHATNLSSDEGPSLTGCPLTAAVLLALAIGLPPANPGSDRDNEAATDGNAILYHQRPNHLAVPHFCCLLLSDARRGSHHSRRFAFHHERRYQPAFPRAELDLADVLLRHSSANNMQSRYVYISHKHIATKEKLTEDYLTCVS